MKKSTFTEDQIVLTLKQGNAGQPDSDICRQMGLSEVTYDVWKKRSANMGLPEVRANESAPLSGPGGAPWTKRTRFGALRAYWSSSSSSLIGSSS